MRILISGSSGLIGRTLVHRLAQRGHRVIRLVRDRAKLKNNAGPVATHLWWDPENEIIDDRQIEGLDAVIHLAGEPIGHRWSQKCKQHILASRVNGTEALCNALSKLRYKPKVLLSASAVGYYGSRGSDWLTEQVKPGGGFLADVAKQWEKATLIAKRADIRTVCMRFGVVLTSQGGMMGQMLTPFRLGLGGKLGRGDQFISWITLHDTINAIEFLLNDDQASGPYNITAPNPVTNQQFTKTLGKVLHRPTRMDMPMFMVRGLFGEMADALLLASQRVRPDRLTEAGFHFTHDQIEDAIRAVMNRG